MATETELTARQELEELAEVYRIEDLREKEAKEQKAILRGPLLDLISEVVRDEIPLSRKDVPVAQSLLTEVFDDDFEAWRTRNFPEWNIVNVATDGETVTFTLEEDDALKKFEFVVNGFKFGRTVQMPTPTFDAESFYKENKEIRSVVEVAKVTVYELDDTKASKYMAENPDSKEVFEKYVSVGRPTVKLLPIRPLQEEE